MEKMIKCHLCGVIIGENMSKLQKVIVDYCKECEIILWSGRRCINHATKKLDGIRLCTYHYNKRLGDKKLLKEK